MFLVKIVVLIIGKILGIFILVGLVSEGVS